jgi:hypothetical protein
MNQSKLDCAVARATGENLRTIQRRGFSPLLYRPRQSHRSRRRTYFTSPKELKETAGRE